MKTTTLLIEDGKIISPPPLHRAGNKNWTATLYKTDDQDGFYRNFWNPSRGRYYYEVPEGTHKGDILEFGSEGLKLTFEVVFFGKEKIEMVDYSVKSEKPKGKKEENSSPKDDGGTPNNELWDKIDDALREQKKEKYTEKEKEYLGNLEDGARTGKKPSEVEIPEGLFPEDKHIFKAEKVTGSKIDPVQKEIKPEEPAEETKSPESGSKIDPDKRIEKELDEESKRMDRVREFETFIDKIEKKEESPTPAKSTKSSKKKRVEIQISPEEEKFLIKSTGHEKLTDITRKAVYLFIFIRNITKNSIKQEDFDNIYTQTAEGKYSDQFGLIEIDVSKEYESIINLFQYATVINKPRFVIETENGYRLAYN